VFGIGPGAPRDVTYQILLVTAADGPAEDVGVTLPALAAHHLLEGREALARYPFSCASVGSRRELVGTVRHTEPGSRGSSMRISPADADRGTSVIVIDLAPWRQRATARARIDATC